MDIKAVLIITNIGLGLLLFCVQAYYFARFKDTNIWSSIKLLYGFVGIYWASIYTLIEFTPESVWRADYFSRYLVRGGITSTLLIMLWGALFRAWHTRKTGG